MKIAMLLSGGVDSSVALALLTQEKTHDITAFYLKIWLEDELSFLGDCPWEEDLSYARQVCEQLGVPLKVVPFQKAYHERVVRYTIDAVRKGLTPNPDVLCNREVKFGAFYEEYGKDFDAIATGHYAQTDLLLTTDDQRQESNQGALVQLLRAPDPVKDQTYFLAMLRQEQVAKALFPIGHLQKAAVRRLATEFDLPTAQRKDSQGICFLGKISFTDFITEHCGTQPGEIREQETRKVLGTHDGFYLYTIGQRKGLDLPGGPWYVCGKDAQENIVYVSHGFAGEDQRRDTFSVTDLNWIAGMPPEKTELQVKLRHGSQLYGCTIDRQPTTNDLRRDAHGAALKDSKGEKGTSQELWEVRLDEKDQGVTPGQFAVFYDGEICLGGGVIA